MVNLQRVTPAEKGLLWSILQKYLYEMTQYYEEVMDASGNYPYRYFEDYFQDPAREAWLIRTGGAVAGFVLCHPYTVLQQSVDYVLAECAVFPVYRGQGLAREAVLLLLQTHPGHWALKFHNDNHPARSFWERVTKPYQPQRLPFGDKETVFVFRVPD